MLLILSHLQVPGIIGIALAAVSHPLGVLLAAILILQWWMAADRASATERVTLAVVVLALSLFVAAFSDQRIVQFRGLPTTLSTLLNGFREHKLSTLTAIGSSLVIVIAAMVERNGRDLFSPVWQLALFGLSGVGAYLMTDRFAGFEGFEVRYVIPVVVCACICAALVVGRNPDLQLRSLAIGMMLGGAISLTAVNQYTELRGPLETALMKYRFLVAAEKYRETCREGTAIVFEYTTWAPLVMCRPQKLAPPFVAVPNATPFVGSASHSSSQIPGVFVPTAVFR